MATIKYIDNKQENGIEYDWKAIKKIMDGLGIPEGYYKIPWGAISNGNKYFLSLSERATGKTTTWLLLALSANAWSGGLTKGVYIRPTEEELAQSHAEYLMDVINTYNDGQYIKRLTKGKYNCLVWHWRAFYYAIRDEEGKITERAPESCIICLSVDRAMDYKSTLNVPYGDILIYDEMIGKRYRPDEAIRFLDLTKTVIRERFCPIIALLGNTISVTSQYFEELQISRDIKRLRKGERKEIVTEKGTKMYIEIVDINQYRKKDTRRAKLNSLFYGFDNPKLDSIRGGGELFAFEAVPHINHNAEERRVLNRNLYIETVGELLQIEFVYNEIQGYHLEVHRASRTYDDSIILSLRVVDDRRYQWALGAKAIEDVIGQAIDSRSIYFSSNEVGAIFYDYIDRVFIEKRRH